MPPHSTACSCVGIKILEAVKIRAHLFNFKSLLRVIFLSGNIYINVHIGHDDGACLRVKGRYRGEGPVNKGEGNGDRVATRR